jgi:hypothetical protein
VLKYQSTGSPVLSSSADYADLALASGIDRLLDPLRTHSTPHSPASAQASAETRVNAALRNKQGQRKNDRERRSTEKARGSASTHVPPWTPPPTATASHAVSRPSVRGFVTTRMVHHSHNRMITAASGKAMLLLHSHPTKRNVPAPWKVTHRRSPPCPHSYRRLAVRLLRIARSLWPLCITIAAHTLPMAHH